MANLFDYIGLTFDAQTVYTSGFRLGTGLLKELTLLPTNKVPIVLSKVVMAEIAKGFHGHIREELDRLRTTHSKLFDLDIVEDAHPTLASSATEAEEIAEARLNRFWKDLGATTISPNSVPINQALDLYFANKPPFRRKGKKAEFPDAIALLSLEAYAKGEGQKILAISGDADWTDFCAASDWIDIVPTIKDAIKIISDQISVMNSEKAKRSIKRATELLTEIETEANARLVSEFRTKLAAGLDVVFVDAEADGPYEASGDQVDFTLKDFELSTSPDDIGFVTYSQEDESVSVELPGRVLVDASAYFSLDYWDSVDREYVHMGSNREIVTTWIDMRVIVRLDIEDELQPTISEVEIVEFPKSLDFGNIEPSMSNEHYFPEGHDSF